MTFEKWKRGDPISFSYIDMRPSDMEPLSQAPSEKPTASGGSNGFREYEKKLSKKEEEQRSVDRMFERAKNLNLSDAEDEERALHKPTTASAGYGDEDWE